MKGVSPVSKKAKRLQSFLLIFGCILFIFILYSNSLRAPFIFDDYPSIVENPDIKSIHNLGKRLIYPSPTFAINRNQPTRPLTYLTFALNYYLGQLDPFGYHLWNVILHILVVIVIFFLTRKILQYLNPREQSISPNFSGAEASGLVLPVVKTEFNAV